MYDADDHFTRWVHALCAIPVGLFVLFEIYLILTQSWFGVGALVRYGLGTSAFYLEYRLIKYAITGRDCINNINQ